MAINMWSSLYPLEEWVEFWKATSAGDVLWAQDVNDTVVADFELIVLGTQVLVDRQGNIAFRSDGPSGYKKLRSEIEKVL